MLFIGKFLLQILFLSQIYLHYSYSKTIITAKTAILHLWMRLSHVSLMRFAATKTFEITINCSSGDSYHLTNLHSNDILAKGLFKAVERVTGIPYNKQMLFYKKKAIDPNSSLKIDNGSCIDLLVKGCGGGGETESHAGA